MIMNTRIIDNSGFPVRKVTQSFKVTNTGAAKRPPGVAYFLALECGHEVGLKAGFEIPTEARCYHCHKAVTAVEP